MDGEARAESNRHSWQRLESNDIEVGSCVLRLKRDGTCSIGSDGAFTLSGMLLDGQELPFRGAILPGVELCTAQGEPIALVTRGPQANDVLQVVRPSGQHMLFKFKEDSWWTKPPSGAVSSGRMAKAFEHAGGHIALSLEAAEVPQTPDEEVIPQDLFESWCEALHALPQLLRGSMATERKASDVPRFITEHLLALSYGRSTSPREPPTFRVETPQDGSAWCGPDPKDKADFLIRVPQSLLVSTFTLARLITRHLPVAQDKDELNKLVLEAMIASKDVVHGPLNVTGGAQALLGSQLPLSKRCELIRKEILPILPHQLRDNSEEFEKHIKRSVSLAGSAVTLIIFHEAAHAICDNVALKNRENQFHLDGKDGQFLAESEADDLASCLYLWLQKQDPRGDDTDEVTLEYIASSIRHEAMGMHLALATAFFNELLIKRVDNYQSAAERLENALIMQFNWEKAVLVRGDDPKEDADKASRMVFELQWVASSEFLIACHEIAKSLTGWDDLRRVFLLLAPGVQDSPRDAQERLERSIRIGMALKRAAIPPAPYLMRAFGRASYLYEEKERETKVKALCDEAQNLVAAGDLKQARALASEATAISIESEPTLERFRPLQLLASICEDRDELEEARELYSVGIEALESWSEVDIAQSLLAGFLNGLAIVQEKEGRFDEAVVSYKRAVEFAERSGKGAVASLENLADLLEKRGELQGAAQAYRKALACRRKNEPRDERKVMQGVGRLARIFEATNRHEDLVDLWGEIVKEEETRRDPVTLGNAFNHIGGALLRMNKLEEARAALQTMREKFWDVLDEQTQIVTLMTLGRLYGRESRHDEAKPLYEEAITAVCAILFEDAPDPSQRGELLALSIQLIADYAKLVQVAGKQVEATAFLQQFAAKIREALGWQRATARSHQWWEAFEKANREQHYPLVVRVLLELCSIQATIQEYVDAAIDGDANDVRSVLTRLAERRVSSTAQEERIST